MTTLLTRVGPLESRTVTHSLRSSEKRKRPQWLCPECWLRTRPVVKQRRAYGNDTLDVPPEQQLFNPFGSRSESEDRVSFSGASRKKGTREWKPWGIRTRKKVDFTSAEPAVAAGGIGTQAIGTEHALWEEFERTEEDAEQDRDDRTATQTAPAEAVADVTMDASLLDVDYTTRLPEALANNEPDMVARCLYAAQRNQDLDFICSIPRTTFVECLRILQPSNFIAPLASAQIEMSSTMARQLGFTPIHQVAWQYSKILRDILEVRRSSGWTIGLAEYKLILQASRDLGNKGAANYFWHLLLSDGHTPDTACYNAMMAANVWNGVHQSESRHKVRVIHLFQLARQQPRPGPAFANYRVGNKGLKEQVMHVFSDMLKHGAIADEESFRNIIMAAAREGDLATVKSVLRKVWDIDVDALTAAKDESSIIPKSIDVNSPLRPTAKLLFALAHAFGINNDVPTALRLVNFVARRYEIDIDLDTWKQLFEWTFVLSIRRTGVKARTDGTRNGQLPLQSVLSLWEAMTGPPYFVEPTMGMYNHLVKNLWARDHSRLMYEKMLEGHQLYMRSVKAARNDFNELSEAVSSRIQGTIRSREDTRRRWESLDLIRKRNLFWCKRWLRLLLSTLRSYQRKEDHNDWTLSDIPRILWNWRHLAPSTVWYEIPGGQVELTFRSEEEIEANRRHLDETRAERVRVLEKVPLFVSEEFVRPKLHGNSMGSRNSKSTNDQDVSTIDMTFKQEVRDARGRLP